MGRNLMTKIGAILGVGLIFELFLVTITLDKSFKAPTDIVLKKNSLTIQDKVIFS